jgi:N-acetylglucosamine kinase-like BadF-type ATPase
MAGVDREEDKATVRAWLQELWAPTTDSVTQSPRISIYNDAIAALASGTGGVLERGLVIISGTGMICYGINEQLQHRRSGGWG